MYHLKLNRIAKFVIGKLLAKPAATFEIASAFLKRLRNNKNRTNPIKNSPQ